jgi:tagatose-1,6-bisphosphate aldolase non-catalytic subunit AgaZ/GatZ
MPKVHYSSLATQDLYDKRSFGLFARNAISTVFDDQDGRHRSQCRKRAANVTRWRPMFVRESARSTQSAGLLDRSGSLSSRIVWSWPAERAVRPSGEKATVTTVAVCPPKQANNRPVATSRSRTQ